MKNNSSLKEFYQNIDRSYFMTGYKERASADTPMPIGYGQTISQPSLVYYMTELLDIVDNHRILEIGTGSGYQTAFLAEFGGEVFTIERIQPLYEAAMIRLNNLGYENIHFTLGDGSDGLEAEGPYDRIIVTAAASKIPEPYINQLKPKGLLLIPVGTKSIQTLFLVEKDATGDVIIHNHGMVRFVPLVGTFEI